MSAAIALFLGKGSWIIAGYNTASEEEKAKYDKKKLCKSMGVLCFIAAFLLFVMTYFTYQVIVGMLPEQSLLTVALVFIIVLVVTIIAEMIYSNTICKK